MSDTAVDFGALGWEDRDRHTSELDAQRGYLEANNGLAGLEILDPSELDRAVRIFDRRPRVEYDPHADRRLAWEGFSLAGR